MMLKNERPLRKQIDYILVRKEHQHLTQDARSYSGISTKTDHRLVVATISARNGTPRVPHPKTKKPEPRLRYDQLKERSQEYHENFKIVASEMQSTDDSNNQTKWTRLSEICHEATKRTVDEIQRNKKSSNPEVIQLSEEQKGLNARINSNISDDKRKELKAERNQKLHTIRVIIENEKASKLNEQVAEIEAKHTDNTKMLLAVKALRNEKPKKKLVIDQPNGGTTKEAKEQVVIIRQFFENFFSDKDYEEITNIPPMEMRTPFTDTEVKKAINKLKNGKSVGIDNIKAEQLKYGPHEVAHTIAEIINDMAKTGEYPREIKHGILTPLQKPGKKSGPCTNLRPIILLSMLRKILAICVLNRVIDRIVQSLPNSQAAYQQGRSMTEQIFTLKLLIEHTISSQNLYLWLLLMDMSKAFDTVKRKILLEDLREILQPDELHLCKLLTENVQFSVKVEKEISEPFTTKQGIAQGDCLSAIFFILYLAKALGYRPHLQDHSYAIRDDIKCDPLPEHLREHDYQMPEEKINQLYHQAMELAVQYADDCGYAILSENKSLMNYRATTIPPTLRKRNLMCNEEKNEDFLIKNKGDENWKSCKYLGSLLDTAKDIKRRKALTISAMKDSDHIWKSPVFSQKSKLRIFDSYIKPIFLSNSELWTVTSNIEGQIDSFQRRLLRWAINIRYPKKISTNELKERLKYQPWSVYISTQRLRWLGHALRLPEDSPAKQALYIIDEPILRTRGRPKLKWIDIINAQLKQIGVTWTEAKNICTNRNKWRRDVVERWRRAQNATPVAKN